MNFTHRQTGLSLIELLAVIAIIGVVSALGTPALSAWLADKRVGSLSSDLARDIHHARAAAAYHGLPVVLCATRATDQCDPASRLSDGWMVFINADNDSPAVRDAGERIVRVHEPTVHVRTLSNRRAFHFRPMGLRNTNGTVVACASARAAIAKAVVVSYSGRARIMKAQASQSCT